MSRKPNQSRIQQERREIILRGALSVFSTHGFRGSTLDQIATAAGLSKPNILYYFKSKEEIFVTLMNSLLETWLDPLRALSPTGEPLQEILNYVRQKLDLSQQFEQESRLFANEMLQGAPHVSGALEGPLRALVDEKADLISTWVAEGKLADVDPYHLIFSIWATTQHYADFSTQVQAVLGPDRDPSRYADAESYLVLLYTRMLTPHDS